MFNLSKLSDLFLSFEFKVSILHNLVCKTSSSSKFVLNKFLFFDSYSFEFYFEGVFKLE